MHPGGPAILLSCVLVASAVAATRPADTKGAEHLVRSMPALPASSSPRPASPTGQAPFHIRIGPAFGWERCLTLDNGLAEVFVVPAIGRVMRFSLIGQPGPFWEDVSLRGKPADPTSTEWINFGGDKTWPAPQEDWPKVTPRAWPPPVPFDATAHESAIRRDALVLRSEVDPHYGIRTERVIRLVEKQPVMTIETTYHKVSGPPVRVAVWIITQLNDPIASFALLPATSRHPEGFQRQFGEIAPDHLRVENGLLALRRDTAKSAKIGLETDRLLWVGQESMLLIESPRLPGAEYPDGGSSAEIYTNPDPKPYVELETLGPLATLAEGMSISQTNTYTLLPRRAADPAADARRVLTR